MNIILKKWLDDQCWVDVILKFLFGLHEWAIVGAEPIVSLVLVYCLLLRNDNLIFSLCKLEVGDKSLIPSGQK